VTSPDESAIPAGPAGSGAPGDGPPTLEPATDHALDETTMGLLRAALAPLGAGAGPVSHTGTADVPADVLAAARASFTWRTVDAELATLSYDSLLADAGPTSTVRSGTPAPRVLTFSTPRLDLEVELIDGRLDGQLLPGSDPSLAAVHLEGGDVEICDAGGPVASAPVDELGCFSVGIVPDGPVRFLVRLPQARVATDWTHFA
jgi:hypothetical protein